jgi:hypothetical protein
MPRTRTTPTTTKTIHYDTVDVMVLQIGYDNNLQMSAVGTNFTYAITNRDAGGGIIEHKKVEIPWTDIPAGVRTKLREIHAVVLTHAENQGIIGAGTDANDLP